MQWNAAGSVFLADLTAGGFLLFYGLDRLGRGGRPAPRTAAVLLAFLAAFLLVYLIGFFNLETGQALDQFVKGLTKWLLHFGFLIVGVIYLARKPLDFYWRTLAWFLGGIAFNGAYGILQLLSAQAGHNLDSVVLEPLTHGASQINIYGAVNGSSVYRPNALTGDPNHLAIELLLPILILSPLYLRLERGHRLRTPLAVVIGFLLLAELATLSRSGLLGLIFGTIVLLVPYRRLLFSRLALLPLGLVAIPVAFELYHRRHFFSVVIRSRIQTGGSSTSAHLGVYDFIPQVLHQHPLFGLGFNNFSVYYEFVTGKTNWGPHSYYVMLIVEGGLVGAALFAVFLWWLFVRLSRGPAARPGARGGRRSAGRAAAAARVGDDRRARRDAGLERLLPDDPVPLLLRLRDAGAGDSCGLLPAMKVVVLTTSYPRYEGDPAGNFVADAVEQLRERGVEVDVVSPASFRHFGIAYGSGVMGNLKRSPWKAALVPAMLGSFAQAARRAARDADLVHAHWLPSGAVALATGQAVRGAALGDRRRAGAADARPRSPRALAGTAHDLRLERARRGGPRARRAARCA